MGNPVKKARVPGTPKERTKKIPVKKEPKMITVYYRIYKKPAPVVAVVAVEEDVSEAEVNPEAEPVTPVEVKPVEFPVAPVVEEPFARSVQVGEKARMKRLKKQILEDLSLEQMCSARLYVNGEHHVGEMDPVVDLGSDRVEVEVFFSVTVSVQGKGSSYVTSIEVSPNDTLE